MAVIGLDLGGTKLSGAIFNESGEILKKEIYSLDNRAGSEVGALINRQIKQLFLFASSADLEIQSIGVCIPGISYSKTGCVWAPNIPGWDNYPLLQEITSNLPSNDVKVKIDSDRACYILGEVWQGAAQGCKDAVFLAVGTGIGAGIFVNGEVLRGSNDIAGAIGWLALDRPFMRKYIQCGCFEYHASGEGISKVAKELLNSNRNYSGELSKINENDLTAKHIFSAYKNGDKIAEQTLQIAVEFWGMAAANLVSLFNPEKIIFGGGVFGPAENFINEIMIEAKKWAQPISINQVKLEVSTLHGDAGLIGAGFLALRNIC